MNRSDLIDSIAKETGLTASKSKKCVEVFFSREIIQVPPKKLPFFKCSKGSMERVDYK